MAFEQSNFIGGLSSKFYRRVVQQILSEDVQQIISEGCPKNLIEGLFYVFSKTKIFCFENCFSYMENACVRELVRTRDMGHDM